MAGDYTVTGTYDEFTDTATLHVTAATLNHIVVSPDTASIAAGATQTYSADGFDIYGNWRGDVTSGTIFTISVGGSCTDAACGSTLAGDYTVTGTDGLLTDTATLHVTAAALDHIVISPASATIAAGATQTYSAEGFDTYGNTRGSVTRCDHLHASAPADLAQTRPVDQPLPGTTPSPEPTVCLTDTATLHVTAAALDHIVVSPASATIAAGATQAYTAEGFDIYDNSRGSVTGATIFTHQRSRNLPGGSLWINPCRGLHRHRNRRLVDRHRHPACDGCSPSPHRDLPRLGHDRCWSHPDLHR